MKTLYPLTAFEEYMLTDETIDHPMTFFLRADLVGQVNVANLSDAFSEVVDRHPIFWSTVVRRDRRHLSWKIVPERLPILQVRRTKSFGECHLKSHIDLLHEPGIRAQLNLAGPSAELWLQFHHSCSDGMGGLRFLDELFEAYRLRVPGEDLPPRRGRGRFPLRRCAFQNLSRHEKNRRLPLDCARIWAFLHRRLVELTAQSAGGRAQQPTPTPSFVETRLPFTSAMMQQLKRTQPLAPTVNDVLMRDIYLALGDWIRNEQPHAKRRWIRISAAINMRYHKAKEIYCHNDVSMVFIDRRLRDLKNQSELLGGISAEMHQIKKDRMGHAMLRGLSWARAIPGGIAVARKLHSMYATAVVSNLGNVFSQHDSAGRTTIGNLKIHKFGFLVPIRAGTPVSFGVLTYAGELMIGMQYDDGVMQKPSAERLLTYVTERLAKSLGIELQPAADDDIRRAA